MGERLLLRLALLSLVALGGTGLSLSPGAAPPAPHRLPAARIRRLRTAGELSAAAAVRAASFEPSSFGGSRRAYEAKVRRLVRFLETRKADGAEFLIAVMGK